MKPQQNLKPLSSSDSPASFACTYLYPHKKVSGSGYKNAFSFAVHEQTKVRKVICDENEL